jgi:hypothetical protein
VVEVENGHDIHPVFQGFPNEPPPDEDALFFVVAQKHFGDAARLSVD